MGLNGLYHIPGTFCEARSAKFRHVPILVFANFLLYIYFSKQTLFKNHQIRINNYLDAEYASLFHAFTWTIFLVPGIWLHNNLLQNIHWFAKLTKKIHFLKKKKKTFHGHFMVFIGDATYILKTKIFFTYLDVVV